METKVRKRLRLDHYEYLSEGFYFITICINDFKCLFGFIGNEEMHLNTLGQFVQTTWLSIPNYYPSIEIHEMIVMPNHIHGILKIIEENQSGKRDSITKAVGGFKAVTSKYAKANLVSDKLWQRGFYDHIIRKQESLIKIENYIAENPIKWSEDKFYLK